MRARTPSKIVSSRASSGSRAAVRQHPDAPARRRPPLPWTIPYPHAAVPGSMPRTFTKRSYAGARMFPSPGTLRLRNKTAAREWRRRGREAGAFRDLRDQESAFADSDLRLTGTILRRPRAQALGRRGDVRGTDRLKCSLELLRLLGSRDLARLDTGVLEHLDVLAVGVGKRLDVGLDLLWDVVGELGEGLRLLLELPVGSTRRSGERLTDAQICSDEPSAVLVGEVEVTRGAGAVVGRGVVSRGVRVLLDRRRVRSGRVVVASAATGGDERQREDEDREPAHGARP